MKAQGVIPTERLMLLQIAFRAAWSNLGSIENGRRVAFLRIAVLASSALLMLPGAWGHSVTVVEFAHLPAGLVAWQRHSLGIYRVCGPLSKLLYALPAHLAGVRVDYPEFFDSDALSRREWEVGRIFQEQNCERYHDIYRWSRLVPILVTILGGCLVCEWSTRLFGDWPGVVSLCVWSWTPPILANGSLVTSDMPSAVSLLLAARCFWAFLVRPNWATTILAGTTLGLAQATKFTLLILYPCWGLLFIGRALQLRGVAMVESRKRCTSTVRLVAFGMAILIISLVAFNALYLFQDMGFCLEQLRSLLSSLPQNISCLGEWRATAWLLRFPLPIPLEFLRGLDFQLMDTEREQSAYMLGQTRIGGWWYWYPVAYLIKVPLPDLMLFALAIVRLPTERCGRDSLPWAGLCILLPAAEAALVIAATTGTGTNAAFRYLVPSIALLSVWVGSLWSSGSIVIRLTSILLLGWLAVNAVVSAPDHLGWQNELGWGWNRWSGRPALIGDSLDWGQDIARLAEWASRHSGEGSTLICVYGLGDTKPYGLRSPLALPISNLNERSAHLAVSEEVLFGDNIANYVSVDGKLSDLNQAQRETLLHTPPLDRVGRTIRIYRVCDLTLEMRKWLEREAGKRLAIPASKR